VVQFPAPCTLHRRSYVVAASCVPSIAEPVNVTASFDVVPSTGAVTAVMVGGLGAATSVVRVVVAPATLVPMALIASTRKPYSAECDRPEIVALRPVTVSYTHLDVYKRQL